MSVYSVFSFAGLTSYFSETAVKAIVNLFQNGLVFVVFGSIFNESSITSDRNTVLSVSHVCPTQSMAPVRVFPMLINKIPTNPEYWYRLFWTRL